MGTERRRNLETSGNKRKFEQNYNRFMGYSIQLDIDDQLS